MTREQVIKGGQIAYDIKQVEEDLAVLRSIKQWDITSINMGSYGRVHADEELLKRLIAVCIAHHENKLSRLEEELKKI